MELREVTIAEILTARDERAARQRRMSETHRAPLISMTMNIAGPVKRDEWIERAYDEGVRRVNERLVRMNAEVSEFSEIRAFTGCEGLWAVRGSAEALKEAMCELEERDELGRLMDIDVLDESGQKLARPSGGERKCLICGQPARVCGRSRAHSVEELFRRTHEIIVGHFSKGWVRTVALRAEKALLYELATTPKPGLVDMDDSGAHRDMDRFTFLDSACALRDYFARCVRTGMTAGEESPEQTFARLRREGLRAEDEMRAATGGVNTHKGAIYSLGLLCCAAGMGFGGRSDAEALTGHAAALAKISLRDWENLTESMARTGGEWQYLALGLTGARGEAAGGFPSVREVALPELRRALGEGKSPNDAGLAALMALMASVNDSNVLRRAGEKGRDVVRQAVQSRTEWTKDELRSLNEQFIRDNLSPGGCADLLAVAWFLHWMDAEFTKQREEK